VIERVAAAARAAGRRADSIRIVAVTKSVGPELAHALVSLGSRELGENRVSELERKASWFSARDSRPRWHFIGHIQRNKVRRAVKLAQEIHSVDSVRLLEDLARIAREERRLPGIYLQVKLSEEPTKTGVSSAEFPELFARARESPLALLGLMTLAPPIASETGRLVAHEVFRELARLASSLPSEAFLGGRPRLSMGMSGDFEEAIAEGADVVRIGSAFFEGIETGAAAREGAR